MLKLTILNKVVNKKSYIHNTSRDITGGIYIVKSQRKGWLK